MTRALRTLPIVAFVIVASTVAVSARAQEVTPDARVHFTAGVNLLRDPAKPRYEEAYREFKAAYAIAPVTQILGNLGLCAMMLERDSEAIDAYERYLKGMIDLDAKDREQIDRDLQTLKLGVTRIKLSANMPGVTVLDKRIPTQGDPVTNVYGPLEEGSPTGMALGIRQGHHIMTARLPGRPELVWETDTVAGEMAPHVFEFPKDEPPPRPVDVAPPEPLPPPPPPPDRPIPRSFWYAAGATGVLAVATTITGVAALSARSSYKSANEGTTPERAEDLRSNAKTLNVTTDVLLVGTLVGAAVTTFIYLTRPEKAPSAPAMGLGFARFGLP